MNVLQRAKGLMLSPRQSWDAIAAEGDSTRFLLTRYVPILAVGAIVINLLMRWLFGAAEPTQSDVFIRRPDGSVQSIGTQLSAPLSMLEAVLLIVPVYLAQIVLGILAMRAIILMNAPRFAARPDRIAATKLAAYAPTPAWLGVALGMTPYLGPPVAMLLWGYSLYLVGLGAPVLLPPQQDERARFGRSMAIRAVLVCLGVTVLAAVVLMLVAPAFSPLQ